MFKILFWLIQLNKVLLGDTAWYNNEQGKKNPIPGEEKKVYFST